MQQWEEWTWEYQIQWMWEEGLRNVSRLELSTQRWAQNLTRWVKNSIEKDHWKSSLDRRAQMLEEYR